MKVNVNYQKYGSFDSQFYAIRISIDQDGKEYFYPFFYRNLITDDNVWLNATNLLSETYLKENNIEYIIDKNTQEIIPIGIVEFCKDYGNDVLKISCKKTDELYKVDQTIKNIIEAIKIKYNTYQMAIKCLNRTQETIDI